MHLTPKENRDLVISKSRNGRGIFTRRNFAPQEVVFKITGTMMTCNEEDDMDEETRANTYRYDEQFYISPKERIGDFLNHSCDPNAKVVKRGKSLFIEAIKSIPKGKEVFIDYSTIIASDDSWKMNCNCGSKRCRMIIGMFKSLPKEIREKYISFDIVPSYILEL